MKPKDIQLKVQEALQEEAYKGIVRIDTQTMRQIEAKPGDIIEIEGGRKTVGIADRAYPSDIGQSIIRMDGIIRRNAKTGIGEIVKVRKAEVREAKMVIVAPAQRGVMVQANPNVFKQGLLGRAIVKGDIISLGGVRRRKRTMSGSPFEDIFNFNEMFEEAFVGGFGSLRFIVADTNPKGAAVIVTENTDLKVSSKAVEVTEEKVPDVTYEDIGGLDEEVTKIREMVELPLKNPELFERLGISPPKGVLLHGPPGTGKTLLAKAVANESNANFLLVNGPELTSKFYGETEKRIRDLFEEAEKNAPSIIFIDEIDSLAPKREETFGEVERRMVSQLLTMMDGLKSRGKVIVIGATNRPNALDPALRRPGRFDREIVIGVPNKEGRLKILKIHTRNMPIVGRLHPSIIGTELINVIETEIKKSNLSKEQAEKEIESLDKKRGNESFLSELKNKINFIERKIQKLKNIIELFKYKEKLEDAIKIIISIEHNIKVFGENNEQNEVGRTAFLNKRKDEKSNEIIECLFQLKSWDIINEEFYIKCREKGWKEKDITELANTTHGFVGADLEALCKEAAMNVLRRVLPDLNFKKNEVFSEELLSKLRVTPDDFKVSLKIVRPSALREVLIETPEVKWEDIGGLEEVKQNLKESVELPLKQPEVFTRMGIKPPKGILLYGPPGTGKTLLAKAVANESEANFISVKGPELLSKWVGESEKGVRRIFEKARQTAPAIIFFDEIDALAPRRGMDLGNNVTERVVNSLLTEIDGLEDLHDVVILAATNRPDLVDPALLRPGRFDRLILTPLPDEMARREILEVHIKDMPLGADVSKETLVEKTEKFNGADIQALCREAALESLKENIENKEIMMSHFEKALKKVSPSIKDDDVKRYKQIEETYIKAARAGQVTQAPNYLG